MRAREKSLGAQHLLLDLERYIKDIRRFLPTPVAYLTTMGVIVDATEALLRLLGRRDIEVIGRSILDFCPHPEQLEALRLETVERGSVRGAECSLSSNAGIEVPVLVDTMARHDEQGDHIGFFASFVDITERREAEEARHRFEQRIHQAQKLESLGVLASGIAHDFNNILFGVLGNISLAQMKLSAGSPVQEHLQRAERAAERAADLTHQMLAYSGKGRFVVEPLDLSGVITEMDELLDAIISKKAVRRYQLAPGLPRVEGDAAQVRQVVMNLFTNASDAIGDAGGVISATTGTMEADAGYLAQTFMGFDLPAGCYVFLEVTDTGCGMDEPTLQKIFDPFFTTKFTGRGLGLAALLGIVRGHKGAIRVNSEPGRGTSVKVLFPVADEPVEANIVRPVEADSWRGEGLVLVVDDEEIVRSTAERVLEALGFEVLLASDGREGLETFRSHADQVRVVLLDMTMPERDGRETFTALRRLRPDVRVILSSGYNEQEVTSAFAGEGLAGFIQKPYAPHQLAAVLRGILEG